MNKISQLLHKQLWSKRTSWIIFAVLIAGCGLAGLFENWVTPRERRVVQETITRADEVASPEILSSSEFEKQSAALLQLADNAASVQITERDKVAALLVRGYVAQLLFRRAIWNMPEAKLEGLKIEDVPDGNGKQKKLDWLALEEKQHKQHRDFLERMIGNQR
jgi:hypothetical protein